MSSTSDASRSKSLESWLDREYRFDVIADPGGGYVVSFPDLPGCMTQVETLDELPEMATQAKEIWMRSMFERGLEISLPTFPETVSGKFLVRLPRVLHRALVDRAEEEGVSLNQLVVHLLSRGSTNSAMKSELTQLADSIRELSEKVDGTQRKLGALGQIHDDWMRLLSRTITPSQRSTNEPVKAQWSVVRKGADPSRATAVNDDVRESIGGDSIAA